MQFGAKRQTFCFKSRLMRTGAGLGLSLSAALSCRDRSPHEAPGGR